MLKHQSNICFGGSHVSQQPIRMLKRQSQNSFGDVVTNWHQGKCVKLCLTDMQVAGSQNNMEPPACKYGPSISPLNFTIRVQRRNDH